MAFRKCMREVPALASTKFVRQIDSIPQSSSNVGSICGFVCSRQMMSSSTLTYTCAIVVSPLV